MDIINRLFLREKEVFFTEIKIKEYKGLLKILFGDPDTYTLFYNLNRLLVAKTNLTLQEVQELDLLDWFTLVMTLREYSIGANIQLVFANKSKINADLNISRAIEKLKEIQNEFIGESIQYRLPTIQEMTSDLLWVSFIDTLDGIRVDRNLTPLQVERIENTIPIQYLSKITKKIDHIVLCLDSVNLLDMGNRDDLTVPFSLSISGIVYLLKLLFEIELDIFYSNIIYLTKNMNIQLGYLDECTPGEYYIFLSKINGLDTADPTDNLPPIPNDNLITPSEFM